MGQYDVSTFDLDPKAGIGEGLRDDALHLECFFLLFCHKNSVQLLSGDICQQMGSRMAPSPLQLAESYNPSIGLADRSSENTRHSAESSRNRVDARSAAAAN